MTLTHTMSINGAQSIFVVSFALNKMMGKPIKEVIEPDEWATMVARYRHLFDNDISKFINQAVPVEELVMVGCHALVGHLITSPSMSTFHSGQAIITQVLPNPKAGAYLQVEMLKDHSSVGIFKHESVRLLN